MTPIRRTLAAACLLALPAGALLGCSDDGDDADDGPTTTAFEGSETSIMPPDDSTGAEDGAG